MIRKYKYLWPLALFLAVNLVISLAYSFTGQMTLWQVAMEQLGFWAAALLGASAALRSGK